MEHAARLLARVRVKDAEALDALYDEYHRAVYDAAIEVLRDAACAANVTEEIFLEIWNSPASFESQDVIDSIVRAGRKRALDRLQQNDPGREPESAALKMRIMNHVRAAASATESNVGEMRAVRPIVWPAYVVAAACLVIALITGVMNISLNDQVRQRAGQISQILVQNHRLLLEVAHQRTVLLDLVSPDSVHYVVDHGEVVRNGKRLYLAMHALPPPPRGKVYQAWTMHAGSTRMAPSVTFIPNASGAAVVTIPVDASSISAVEVTLEPDGGSKRPSSTPIFLRTFN